ncbi:MAG TPA: hypothetical protein VMT53_11540 [Terriglobales bacterium]|nr:hypothetical protein [Terriglobales bacterium]
MTSRVLFVRALVVIAWALVSVFSLASSSLAQTFSCPAGQIDVMKYFVMDQQRRPNLFMSGSPNPIYTEVYPNHDFAASGYWFWLKSPSAHGFDVKAFDKNYVYMRSTELQWTNNSTFKRFAHDLPIAARCVPGGRPGPTIKVANTTFHYYQSCSEYKSSNLGTAVNKLDAPVLMNAGGNIGHVWTRVLHYHYDCNSNYQSCSDEEQFFLGNGYGLWQWRHYQHGSLAGSAVMNNLKSGVVADTLACRNSYQ